MKLLTVVCLLTTACYAQETWAGLKFGMTPSQAAVIVKGNINEPKPPADTRATLSLANVKVRNQTGTGYLNFSSGKLAEIELNFNDQEPGSSCTFGNLDSASRRIIRIGEIGDALSEKYGRPDVEKGPWPSSQQLTIHFATQPPRSIESIRTWRTSGQIIEAKLEVVCGTLLLKVRYHLPGSEL
jgi:hypothetical protein